MSQSTETSQPESPQESPDLLPRPGFRWLPPRPGSRNPDSLNPDVTTTTRDHDDHQDQAGEDGRRGKEDTGTSIPGFFRQRAKSYGKIAGALLQSAGGWLNMLAGDVEDAWLPDDEDMETIPPPLGRIAARRIKIGDPGNLTDLEDMGMAAVGIIAYLAKGAAAVMAARRERRRAEAGRAVHADAGDG